MKGTRGNGVCRALTTGGETNTLGHFYAGARQNATTKWEDEMCLINVAPAKKWRHNFIVRAPRQPYIARTVQHHFPHTISHDRVFSFAVKEMEGSELKGSSERLREGDLNIRWPRSHHLKNVKRGALSRFTRLNLIPDALHTRYTRMRTVIREKHRVGPATYTRECNERGAVDLIIGNESVDDFNHSPCWGGSVHVPS